MLNTHDLEKRWLRYKIKSYIPHLVITISILVITVIAINFTSTKVSIVEMPNVSKALLPADVTLVQEPITKEVITQEVITIKEPQRVTNTPHKELQFSKKDTKVQLSPSLGFMKNMQHSSHLYYNTREVQEPLIVKPKKRPKKRVIIEEKIEEVVVQEPIVVVQKKKIKINRQNTQNDIFEIIKRFKKNNNPALSLFVAKKYYELQDYHQAYNYALITNGIDKNIEASWLIFAKSLYKLDKKDKAKKTLKKYIDFSHSSGAKLLLDEMKSGKFR